METDLVVTEVATLSPEAINAASAAAGAFLGVAVMTLVIIAAIWYVIKAIADWKIFKKAGKKGWWSLIPFLNEWHETDLCWNSQMAWVNIALLIVCSVLSSIVNNQGENPNTFLSIISGIVAVAYLVFQIIQEKKLAAAFGKGTGFFIGLILLNPIFKIILGFGSAKYQGRQG